MRGCLGTEESMSEENEAVIRRLYEEVWNQHNPEAADDIDAAYSEERPSRGHWPSEVPPTGVLTGVLGEMAFYYGACWLHHHSAQRRGKAR
jgi:hypothetical protein